LFTKDSQMKALQAGVPWKQALLFTEWSQVQALQAGASVEQALEINDPIVFDALVTYSEENGGNIEGFFQTHYYAESMSACFMGHSNPFHM